MSRSSRPLWVYVSLTVLLVLLVLTLWLAGEDGHQQAVVSEKHAAVVFEDAERMASVELVEPVQQAEPVKKTTTHRVGKTSAGKISIAVPARHGIALILDDVGYDLPALRRAMALGVPMAISILPNAPHAAMAASLAHAAGYAVMLHMPMEPSNPHYQQRMDASFIRVGMQRRKVRRMMNEALIRVPFVEGVNNHMGS
ncbi:MAG: divergent polysaccharide deacetylase family protein, partial [Mariprofundaceae bacterium]|nr:divergent polysaccharide deacetylase family protein [Mariprofundaceae bacterium]